MLTRLNYCKSGQSVKIAKFCGGKGALKNFDTLNLSIGDEIKVIKNEDSKSPVSISYKDEELLIGKELSSKILVESDILDEIILSSLKVGDSAEVKDIIAKGEIRRRLLDMGLVKGVTLEVVRKAPLGDPIAVKLNGFDLSLRINEADCVLVEVKKLNLCKKESVFKRLRKRGNN